MRNSARGERRANQFHTHGRAHAIAATENECHRSPGAQVEERPEWGEWGRYSHENVLKPKSAFYFWLNPITKRASWAEPNWEVAYRQRIERSEFVGEKQGWEQYWDPRFECNFFYNVMDGRLTCVDPCGGAGGEEEGARRKTLAAIEAEQTPLPRARAGTGRPMRALTAEEEKLGMTGPMLLKNDPHPPFENAPVYKGCCSMCFINSPPGGALGRRTSQSRARRQPPLRVSRDGSGRK